MLSSIKDYPTNQEVSSTITKLYVKTGRHIRVVDLRNILYIRASGDYVDIALATGETIHTKDKMARFIKRLPAHQFMRIHRSFIMNKDCIKEIKATNNKYEFTLSNDETLASGPTYRKVVRGQFMMNIVRDAGRATLQNKNCLALSDLVSLYSMNYSEGAAKGNIRICSPGDENTLALLGKTTFVETYAKILDDKDILDFCANHHTPLTYRSWLEDPKTRVWIIERQTLDLPIGYLILTLPNLPVSNSRNEDIEIKHANILGSFYNDDLMIELMATAYIYALKHSFNRILTGQSANNRRAVSLYERLGFTPIGIFKSQIGSKVCDEIIFSYEI
jgi:diamine N-acetyltransferase